ncbi:unnamed protein product [Peronospora effusa]|nr:unnamed protein product [Peronospora effusa]
MVDKDQHARRLQLLSARKSALVSAGGVNARRLVLHRRVSKKEKEKEEEEEIEPNNECGNLFCRQILVNRYAKFCEDKPICQRYRALKLQCLANAQAEEDEEDTWPLLLAIKRKNEKEEEEEEDKEEHKQKEKKKKKEKADGTFAIPRKEMSLNAVGKKKLNLTVSASVANKKRKCTLGSPGRVKMLTKKKKREMERKMYEEKKQRSKRMKKAQKEAAESKKTDICVLNNSSSVQGSSAVSSGKHGLHTKKQKTITLPLVRQSTEISNDAEIGSELYISRIKRRRVSVDNASARSAPSSPIGAVSVASAGITNWRIPREKPAQARTSAQAMRRKMSVDLVPLGVANRTSFAGGRYVQNGNRSAVQSLRPLDPRPRPPSKTKFPAPAVSAAPTSALVLNASSRPAQRTEQIALSHTQRPNPTLPPQDAMLAPSEPQQTARAFTPVAPPVKSPTIRYVPSPLTTSVVPDITRISTTDYLKCKRGDNGRHLPGRQTKHRPSRSSSIERSGSSSDDRASRVLPATAYPTSPPGCHRIDSAPLSSYTVSFSAVDPRRQHFEGEGRHQRSHLGLEENKMRYRERSEVRGECEWSTSAMREAANFPPSRDHYPFRHQDLSETGFSSSDNNYAFDTNVDSASSLAEPSYWRGPTQEELPPPQRVPSTEQHVHNKRKNSTYDDLEKEVPTFSHKENFLPRLLSVFVKKLPQSLEAVFNVTKKPRKMNWYVTYVKRIEHICKAFDLHVKFDGLTAAVTVRGREWLTLQSTSTVSLHLNVIKSIRAEAVTWLRLSEEMESAFDYYKGVYGNQVNESISFLRAWNELKHKGNYISLPRETNYFCGARLHHWNFVVGKVEIGSGSHEEKREAFRLATVSALNFLLSIRRRERPPAEDVVEDALLSAKGHHRSSSRESSLGDRTRASSVTETENGSSFALPYAELPTSVEPLPRAEQSSSIVRPTEHRMVARNPEETKTPSPVKQSITNRLQLPADAPLTGEPHFGRSTSSMNVERTEKATELSSPVIISNSSHKVAEAAERSDTCDELTITDASNMSALTTARSPLRSKIIPLNAPTSSPGPAAKLAASTTPPLSTPAEEISTPLTTEAERKAPVAMLATTVATFGVSAAKATSAMQTNAILPSRRCMMCEMIRMRKPDSERCLRCQQNDAPANRVLRTLCGP